MENRKIKAVGEISEGMTADEFYRYSAEKGPSRHLGAIAGAFRGTGARAALDVGCGGGFTIGRLAKKLGGGALFCGCDTAPEILCMAARRESGVRWVCNGPDSLPFADASFDLVYSEGALHHFEDPLAMFGEMWRVLRPGGRLLVIDLNPKSFAARAYSAFVAVKKNLGAATKPQISLMMSVRNALPMEVGISLLEAAGVPARVGRTLASVYYEAEKERESGVGSRE